MFCLNAVAANSLADPNFTAGATPRFEETRIGAALSSRSREFIVDPTSGLKSLVVDVKSHRGHELGTVGLVLDPSSRSAGGHGRPGRHRRAVPRHGMIRGTRGHDAFRAIRLQLPSRGGASARFKLVFAHLEVRMLGLALVIAIVLSLLSPYFLKTANLLNLLDQSVVVGIVAIGMTFVILTGGIDLSVGSVAGLTGVILGLALQHFTIPISVALAVAVGRRDRPVFRRS